MSSESILYSNIPDGAYELVYDQGSSEYTENVKYGGAEFNRLYTRQVRLPEGQGNVIYVLSPNMQMDLQLLTGSNFIKPATWRRIFYPKWMNETYMGRRIKFQIKDSKTRDTEIKTKTKLIPFAGRVLLKGSENVIFLTSDIFQQIQPQLTRYSLQKNCDNFFSSFGRILAKMTPEIKSRTTGPEHNNRILMIDCAHFPFGGKGETLATLKTNPLYLMYMTYLKNKNLQAMQLDMDLLLCSGNLFIKINPAKADKKMWSIFRRSLFRIINNNLDEVNDQLPPEEQKETEPNPKENTVSAIVQDATSPYTRNVSSSTKLVVNDVVDRKLRQRAAEVAAMDHEIKLARDELQKPLNSFEQSISKQSILHADVVNHPLDQKTARLFQAIGGTAYQSLIVDEEDVPEEELPEEDPDVSESDGMEDEIRNDATEILANDKEVAEEILTEIQQKTTPADTPEKKPVNSARDAKLREAQKKVVVKNSTIEQILDVDASNVPIESDDKSKVLHTTNENMQTVTFSNFDKTYLDHLFVKDLLSCFDMLKDKESPFFITGIEITDTSTVVDYKETWSVHLKDETGRRHTIKIDVPKFQDNKFMYLNGTRFIILKQNFYNPLVKDTPDTVILTTNYNKVTIDRKATKSLGAIERVFALVKRTGDSGMFMGGDSTKANMRYISTLEYDELSRNIFRFTTSTCDLYFSREYIYSNLSDRIPSDSKGNEFYIGDESGKPVLINEDTGKDRMGRTIVEIIEQNLPDEYREIYSKLKPPKQKMYVEAKLAGSFLPVIAILVVWIGLTKTLNTMGIDWKFDPEAKRVPKDTTTTNYIRFADGVLSYEAQTFSELIMNGIRAMLPESLNFSDFDTDAGYQEYIYSVWGSYRGIEEIKAFHEFLIDPITKDVCRDMNLPQDAPGLLIHAVKLLCDNAYVSKADDRSYRVRSIEMIPGILYGLLAKQYKAYVRSGRRIPMTLNQRSLISALLQEKTVDSYSTLNPAIEMSRTYTISTKGYKGANSVHAYRNEQKRSYDPSSVGKLAISTSPDANVGISKNLVVEPTLTNARGYRRPVDPDELKDVNIFSPLEMLTPGTARNDDPIRTAIDVAHPAVAVKLYKCGNFLRA